MSTVRNTSTRPSPEIVIAVENAHRGHGIGALLLDALAEAGAAEGFRALSLSVDDGNPAIRLYERACCEIVEDHDDSVLLRRLP